jgi:hypothetical protein
MSPHSCVAGTQDNWSPRRPPSQDIYNKKRNFDVGWNHSMSESGSSAVQPWLEPLHIKFRGVIVTRSTKNIFIIYEFTGQRTRYINFWVSNSVFQNLPRSFTFLCVDDVYTSQQIYRWAFTVCYGVSFNLYMYFFSSFLISTFSSSIFYSYFSICL